MINVKFDSARVEKALESLALASQNPRPVLLSIGEDLVKSTKSRFNKSLAPDGKAWAPNSPATLKRKRGVKPLINEGILRDNIAYAADNAGVTIFSTMEYAGTQQFGAKKGQFGESKKRNKPIPFGDIPARPFLGISLSDEQMIVESVSDYLLSIVPSN